MNAQTVSLSSTLPGNNKVCPGAEIIFTCVVHGPHLSWSSDEYIGVDGRRMEFGIKDDIGKQHHRLSTIATLLNISKSDEPMIESQLRIVALIPTYPSSAIVCHDVSAGISQNITFNIIGEQ